MHTALSQLRVIARALAPRIPSHERVLFARAFTARALTAYRDRVLVGATHLLPPDRSVPLDPVSEAEAIRLGRSYQAEKRTTAAYLLSTLYSLLLPDDVRAKCGVFFTPPALAEKLLDMVEAAGIDWCDHSVLDPAAGGGAFITPVAARMIRSLKTRNRSPQAVVEHIEGHLRGIELDPFSAWMANALLEIEIGTLCAEAGVPIPRVVVQGDALRDDLGPRRYDLVIGNPPFGRVKLDAALRNRFAISLFGHANLYGVFTQLAVTLCRPGGVVGYITPASFLGGQYHKNLRAFLRSEAPPISIHFIADRDRVFDQVLQETVLITLGRGRAPVDVAVHSARTTEAIDRCESSPSGHFPLQSDPQAPWILPRQGSDVQLLHSVLAMPLRLRDYGFAVSTGPLVWNRHKSQLNDRPGPSRFPLIWAESILSSGEFCFRAENRGHKPFFEARENQERLLMRSAAVLVQRTTAKEQARRIFAAVLPQDLINQYGGVVVENHLNVIYSRGRTSHASLRAIAALLNSRVVDRIFRCINGSVAVSANELDALPVPSQDIMTELDQMLEHAAGKESVEQFLDHAYRVALTEVAA